MAKIVTVHGTFAHIETVSDPAEMAGDSARQWWQSGSAFEAQIRKMVDSDGSSGAPGSEVEFKPFIWNGDNSVTARRKAGSRLLSELKALEAGGEKYCVVAHSHGGSVVTNALVEAASRNVELPGMKRWMTIGTPFIELRPERFLFLRLPLLLKALFVASLMLLFMYVFYLSGELLDGRLNFSNERQVTRLIVSTVLTAIPFVTFYLFALILDGRRLYFYRRSNQAKAHKEFADRWLPLTHEDDEAVRGLASLAGMKLKIFHKDFAVPALSLFSVFMLPLIYFGVLNSPTLMIGVAEYLKTNVYQIDQYKGQESGVDRMVKELRGYRRKIRRARSELEDAEGNASRTLDLKAQIRQLRKERKALRSTMTERFPNVRQVRRAQRFERRFLQEVVEGKRVACTGGKLCGEGRNILINAKLLFHLVTDEVSGLVVDRDHGGGVWWRLIRSAVPTLLVPIAFGFAAIAIVLLFQWVGRLVSSVASGWLDRQTWFEVRRTSVGNDTETEVAVATSPAPSWIKEPRPFLPPIVSQAVADHSNREMSASIVRIRSAISEFALTRGTDGQLGSALDYLSWQELIHTSYFEVPEFRKLIARAIAETDGFGPSTAFRSDQEYHEAKSWLDSLAVAGQKKA